MQTFFRAGRKVLFDASTWSLLFGYRGVEPLTSFLFHIIAKIPVHLAIKLWSIVGYIRLGYSEPAHDVLLYKLNNLDGGEGFSFYPFTKIIDGN